MFWILKRMFSLGVLAALVFFALQFKVGGRPLKDYITTFYQSPLAQEALRQVRVAVSSYLNKDVGPDKPSKQEDLEHLNEEDRKELEKLLRKKSER